MLPGSRRRLAVTLASAIALSVSFAAATGCRRSNDNSLIGTYRMGDPVQAGPLNYQIIESDWRPELNGGKTPKDRYLVLRAVIKNTGSSEVGVPGFELLDAKGTTYSELTEGLEEFPNWLGLIRRIRPGGSLTGFAVFDAPVGPYKLVVSDAGHVADEKHAHIEIPVALE